MTYQYIASHHDPIRQGQVGISTQEKTANKALFCSLQFKEEEINVQHIRQWKTHVL